MKKIYINIVILVLLPLYYIGWSLGFMFRPIVSGFLSGFSAFPNMIQMAYQQEVHEKATKLIENIENDNNKKELP
jgi:hypothetical protein